jgi:hypothetical protein
LNLVIGLADWIADSDTELGVVIADVAVGDSLIHGKGVFAVRRFEAGEVIIDGCRKVLSDEAAAALPDYGRLCCRTGPRTAARM